MTLAGRSLTVNTYAHFCVDFGCFVMLFGGFSRAGSDPQHLAIGFVSYNVIAFGLQPAIGYLVDTHPRLPVSIAGCLLVMAGLFLLPWSWLCLLLCAVGNACFHVGGGIDSLINAGGRMSRSGIFVSSGALGVGLGALAGQQGWPVWIPLALLGVAVAALVRVCPLPARRIALLPVRFRVSSARPYAVILVLCAASIVIRSYVGTVLPIPWKTTTFLLLLPALAACLGKAGGGWLADRFGARRIGVGSLLVSLPFLVFGSPYPAACTVGILAFNMSMSITLCAVFSELPDHPGLSFGLTTLALVAGTLPASFVVWPAAYVRPVLTLCILLSAICLSFAVSSVPGGVKEYEVSTVQA